MTSKQIQPLKREPCSTQSKSKTLVPQRRYGIIVCMLIGHQFSELCICSHCLPYHSMERWEFKRIHCTSQSRDCNYLFNIIILFSYRTRFCDKLWGTRKWSFQAWTLDIPTILAILIFSYHVLEQRSDSMKVEGTPQTQRQHNFDDPRCLYIRPASRGPYRRLGIRNVSSQNASNSWAKLGYWICIVETSLL